MAVLGSADPADGSNNVRMARYRGNPSDSTERDGEEQRRRNAISLRGNGVVQQRRVAVADQRSQIRLQQQWRLNLRVVGRHVEVGRAVERARAIARARA